MNGKYVVKRLSLSQFIFYLFASTIITSKSTSTSSITTTTTRTLTFINTHKYTKKVVTYSNEKSIQISFAMSGIKQKKGSKQSNTSSKDSTSKKKETIDETIENKKTPSLMKRIILFVIFPTCVGGFGLVSAYLVNVESEDSKPVNFDRDFIYPFILALATASVVWYQTNGFTYTKPKPLVTWPKVKRKRKIIRTQRFVDNDDEEDEDEDETKETNTKEMYVKDEIMKKKD